jgi:hypothetical protein
MPLALGAVAGALVLGGCGASHAVGSLVDPVAQAAESSELAPGYRADITELTRAPGSETVKLSGSAVFDNRGERGFMSARVGYEGHTESTAAAYSHGVEYIRTPPGASSSATHGKPWIAWNLASIESALGVSSSSLGVSGNATEPSEMLSYLRAVSGDVTRVGSQLIHGVPTTHYRASIVWARYADTVSPAKRAAARSGVAELERLTGSSTQLVDVWVDSHHRVRREQLKFSECLAGNRVEDLINTEYVDFATQAIPPLPHPTEVTNVTGLITKSLAKSRKKLEAGCAH